MVAGSTLIQTGQLLSEAFLAELMETVEKDPAAEISVDLEAETITNETTGNSETFEINAYKKMCLIKGYDDIDYILGGKADIEAFESKRVTFS